MRERAYPYLMLVGAAPYIVAPALSGKVVQLGVLWTGGALAACLFFAFVDVVHQLYGTSEARRFIIATSVARAVVWLMLTPLIAALPEKNAVPGWYAVMLFTARAYLAGEAATLFSNLVLDVPFFRALGSMPFFAKTNLTNLVSVMVSTLLFMVVSFWGLPASVLAQMTFGQVVFRYLATAVFTPLTAGVVRWVESR